MQPSIAAGVHLHKSSKKDGACCIGVYFCYNNTTMDNKPVPSKFENDLSKGNVVKQLLLFALPFLLSNFLQSLYSVVDMVIVGQFSGMQSMSGVNIGGQVTLVATNLVIGLSAGATVLIGQYLGYKARREMKETIGTLFMTLLIVAVFLTGLMLIFRAPILRALNTPAEAFSEAMNYLLITSSGLIFIFGYNAFSAVMRGLGDSKRPLIFVAIACVTNIGLDILFVARFNMMAFGAALATIISQALSMILCFIYLKRNDFVFDFKWASFKINRKRLGILLKIGAPISLQNVIVSVSFLILTALANTLGVVASAAVGAVGKFNTFAILPALAVNASISAMSAQNLGAGEEKRAVKTMYTGTVIAYAITIIVFLWAQLFPEQVITMFTSESEVIAAGASYLKTYSFDYILVPYMFCMNGLFIGAGHTTFTLISSMLTSIVFRVPSSYIFGIALGWGMRGLGLGAPISAAISLCISLWYFLSGRWRKKIIRPDYEPDRIEAA